MAKETLDGYLSRKLQRIYPTALVYKVESEGGENWVARRPGEPELNLGTWFGLAKQAVQAMVSAAYPKPPKKPREKPRG